VCWLSWAVRVLLPFSFKWGGCVLLVEHKATSHKNFLRKRDDELLRKKTDKRERKKERERAAALMAF
jgi:hypothetical protein